MPQHRKTKSQRSRDPLVQAAIQACEKAYAPYSGFSVGAAVRTYSGAIFSGCNVENGSLGLSMCAERSAVFAAIQAGHRQLREIAIVADGPLPLPPCGACRQVLAEFSPHIAVIMANMAGRLRRQSLAKLLPLRFALSKQRKKHG
ncbi:MAG: cytidine deaminase [Acidobacteriales bacterium]|nr:cytidine deaminase [Terriglobales bacterium]